MPSKRDFLGQLELFADLEPDELDALAEISEEFSFEEGAVIAYQRDVADSLYIVREGRLFAFEVDAHGIVRDSRSYLPGDDFGEMWLFSEDTHPTTVRAGSDGRLIKIDGEKFRRFLQHYPGAIDGLALSEEAAAEAEKSQLVAHRREYATVSLMPDELVEYWSRRTPYLLALTAIPPAAIALGFFTLWLFMVYQNQFAGADWSFLSLVLIFLGGLLFLLIVGFQVLDWYNDYFLITNKQIVHREFSLRTFRTRTHKVPLDQVQSVETAKPNLLANLLNVGSARITTASSMGSLVFDYIDDPQLVKDALGRLTEQVKALDAARSQRTMRRTVEDYFSVAPAYIEAETDEEEEWAFEEQGPSLWARIRTSLGSRVETGNVIRYRKHIFVLLKQTWWLWLIELTLLVGAVLGLWYGWVTAPTCSGLFLLGLAIGAWLLWRFEDWRNDMFLLTDMYVVDIDRRPFGFGESRKQAELNNVQNVRAVRPNFLATIFNFGHVEIETAGVDSNIVFENVVHPDLIQSDIFRRREQARQRRRLRDGEERRKEYAVLLDVYQQAREQDRIPRRTPPPEELPPERHDEGAG